MNNLLDILPELISEIQNSKDVKSLLKPLEKINDLDRDNRNLSDEKQDDDLEEKYKLFEVSYREAVRKIKNDVAFKELKGFSEVYEKIANYWKEKTLTFKEAKISNHIIEGDSLQMQGKYEEALQQYDIALKLSPSNFQNSNILVKIGTCYYNLKRFEKSEKYYKDAEEIDSTNPFAIYSLGILYEKLGKYEEALQQFEKSIKIDQYNPDFFVAAGNIYFRMKKYEEARDYHKRATMINSKSWNAWNGLGAVYNDGFADYENARQCFYKALEINPDSLIVKLNIAEILVILQNYEEAERSAKKVADSTDDQTLGFISRTLIVCIKTLLQEQREKVNDAIFDLLSYYESIPIEINISWDFDGLQKFIKNSKLSSSKKEMLSSLFSLSELNTESQKKTGIERTKSLLRNTENILNRALGRNEISKVEIKIKNTANPKNDRPGWYYWEVFLDETEDVLSRIDKVKYILHPTFVKPEYTTTNKKDKFSLKSEGWGEFRIKVEITTKNGDRIIKYHWLNLGPTPLDKSAIIPK